MTSSLKKSYKIIKEDCKICCESCNIKYFIKCPFCTFKSCTDCTETFLLNTQNDTPYCMNPDCKKQWAYEFIINNFDKSFHNKKYRDYRANIIFEREKSLLPGTQDLYKRKLNKIKNKKLINDIRCENKKYEDLIQKNKDIVREIYHQNRIEDESGDENIGEVKNRKKFIKACPVDNCRGFLSTVLKCEICDTWSCKDCYMPKGKNKDAEHKCDPDLVETMKMLKINTKPCPSCGEGIYKIEGCSQMYCTSCNTAFCWNTGKIETGIIHNPHYYEFQRQQNNGVAPRVRGDIRCGGDVHIRNVEKTIRKFRISKDIYNCHRIMGHIRAIELPRCPIEKKNNVDLRLKILGNEINDKKWKTTLKRRMKENEKFTSFNQILTMFITTLSDLFFNISVAKKRSEVMIYLESIENLRIYTNDNLKRIGILFGNMYPEINENWKYIRNSKSQKKTLSRII